jgi:UTP--glucose-1-phosphate uridylyltransferase
MISKAVVPVGGLGTRFLPATKAMPKEMLPVIDKPVIQFVVEEAVAANLDEILFITGRNKRSLEDHFDRAYELEDKLLKQNDTSKLFSVSSPTDLASIFYVRQGDALGLAHAVYKAKNFVGNQAFALLLGDEIINDNGETLSEMKKLSEKFAANVVALMEVPEIEVSKYGIVELGEKVDKRTFYIKNLVEKPSLELAPSKFAIVGRYILQPSIFKHISTISPGVGGELQLTDALMSSNLSGVTPTIGLVIKGKRYDMGDKLSYLKATIEMGLLRSDLGPQLQKWLAEFISKK